MVPPKSWDFSFPEVQRMIASEVCGYWISSDVFFFHKSKSWCTTTPYLCNSGDYENQFEPVTGLATSRDVIFILTLNCQFKKGFRFVLFVLLPLGALFIRLCSGIALL